MTESIWQNVTVLLLRICFYLPADNGFNSCNTRSVYGVYLWTAGHLLSRTARVWDWKMFTPTRQIRQKVSPEPRELWTYSFMDFYAWHSGQPDYVSSNDECVNVWPERSYEWNDEPCAHEYCFVCEDRNE